MRKIAVVLLALMLATCWAAADISELGASVLKLAEPYYSVADKVAIASPDFGRNFTDHRLSHAVMVAEKAVEVGQAVAESVRKGKLADTAEEGRVAFSADLELPVLEAAGLFHDTGMCGGYAMVAATDSEGNPLADEKGADIYDRGADGLYEMVWEDGSNFQHVRTFHSLNSGLNVLVNRQALRELGFTDAQIDRMAVACMAHSKSNSGVRDLNSRSNWSECFDRLDACVAAWNTEHPEEQIAFDRTHFETDAAQLSILASETLALRLGDVSRDSGPDATVQTGEKVHVDRATLNNRGGSVSAELKKAVITIGEMNDPVEPEKSRQVHAGEQNIPENHTYTDAEGNLVHEITVEDGCSAPRCTQVAVGDHLGELYSARDGRFTVNILFRSFEDEDGFFRDSWEDFRLQSANDYPNVEITYPWDKE